MSNSRNVYCKRSYDNQGFPALVEMVSPIHHRVLDVGCGNGANLELLFQMGHEGVGVTLSDTEAGLVRKRGFQCVVWDITTEILPFPEKSFDALLLSHILEHVPWPEGVLKLYLKLLRPGGGVYIALPNVLHLVQRWQFLCGRFRYTENGLMDETHLRFFDSVTARSLIESCGSKVIRQSGIGQCPLGPLRKLAPSLSARIDRWTSRKWPGLFAFHLIVVARAESTQ